MRNPERGVSIQKINNSRSKNSKTISLNSNGSQKWNHNDFYLRLLDNTKPLLDNSNTPRAA